MSKEPKKFKHAKAIAAYRQGARDRLAHKPPRPPKDKDPLIAKAYKNGYAQT